MIETPQTLGKDILGWWQKPRAELVAQATGRLANTWLAQNHCQNILTIGPPFLQFAAGTIVYLSEVDACRVDVRASPQALPFLPEQFDAVVAPFVFERGFPVPETLREFYRVIKPEGFVLIFAFRPALPCAVLRIFNPSCSGPEPFTSHALLSPRAIRDALVGEGFCHRARRNYLFSRPFVLRSRSLLPRSAGAYGLLAQRREPGWIPPDLSCQRKRAVVWQG